MTTLYQILGLLTAGLIVWIIYKTVKGRPEAFSKGNLQSSFFTMGVLALVLIAFVTLLILLVKTT